MTGLRFRVFALSVAIGFGCFVAESKVYAKNDYRDPDSPTGFGNLLTRTVMPARGRPQVRGKVAVLTGRYVMSSCEAFLLMMKQAPRCRLFGERSYGSSGNPKPVELSNGITLYLPSWRAMEPDETIFEGKGVASDVRVRASQRDFRSGDPVLQAALDWLRE